MKVFRKLVLSSAYWLFPYGIGNGKKVVSIIRGSIIGGRTGPYWVSTSIYEAARGIFEHIVEKQRCRLAIHISHGFYDRKFGEKRFSLFRPRSFYLISARIIYAREN